MCVVISEVTTKKEEQKNYNKKLAKEEIQRKIYFIYPEFTETECTFVVTWDNERGVGEELLNGYRVSFLGCDYIMDMIFPFQVLRIFQN